MLIAKVDIGRLQLRERALQGFEDEGGFGRPTALAACRWVEGAEFGCKENICTTRGFGKPASKSGFG